MAALPENWEMDYDGAISRWIYRFKPTGLTQYTFPKPGDEYPEFVGDFGGPMSPEDKFFSQRLKKGSAGSETIPASPPFNISTTATSANFSGSSYKTPPPWFQPDDFMYMGPGAYNDNSPEQGEDEAALPATDPKTPESKLTKPSTRPFISPVTSTETTPLVNNSRISVLTIPEQNTPARVESAPTTGDYIQSPVVPMLDGRPINQVFPIGFVAELYGESTARPREEHPTAAELPGHEAPIRNIQVANSDQHAPVELSSESISVKATSKGTNCQKADRLSLNQKTESTPFILGANFASGPSNPAPVRTQRHSIQGQMLSGVEVAAVSSEKQTPEKPGLDEQEGKTEPGAEIESNSKANGEADKVIAQRVPSILQPARRRPKPLQNASGSSTTNRFVHRPLYDLPELDHQTVKPLHGHQSMTLLNKKDVLDPPPVFTRTNTLPADLPSLPFMGSGFSSKTETSSPAPKPQHQSSPPPAPGEEEPQMGSSFASTTRPHRGSLSDYANPVLLDIGQSVNPLSIIRKPSPTEAQGVDQSSLAVKKDDMEQTAPMLDPELAQAMREWAFRPHYEPKRATEIVLGLSKDGLTATLWCQERMQLRGIPTEDLTETLPATAIQGTSVPGDGSHSLSQPETSDLVPPRPEKIPLDNSQPAFTPYRPPAGEQTIRRKPITEPQSHEMPTSSSGFDQQTGTFPQQGTRDCYVLPGSHEQQPPSWSVEALPQPDTSNTNIPQTFPAQQLFANPQSQIRASTWPKPESTTPIAGQMDDLASKPLPPVPQVVPQSMPQARGLQTETSSPVVKEKRGLLSKFRRTGNTGNSSNKLQKSVVNGYPTASTSVPQPQPLVSYPPQQSPRQNTETQFQNLPLHPNQVQFQGHQWPAATPDAWSAYGHDPRVFTPTIQLGGPQHEPEFVYQSQPMPAQQQWDYHQQQQQHHHQVDSRRESEVSNLTGTSSPSPVPSNADAVSIADSSRVSIISSHHTRPGSEGAASLASVSTIGRNSEATPPPNFNHRNGPGPSRWGSISGGGGGGQYDGSGWGDFD
ncbi:hypothetical protein B0T09DRAFT_97908 [Sordaria sp. MPI-SDFR-AT-0083]|nr:hypothetical protein B0T09DRAFT_97908 [Sordaria sp. MPI-SDFR-AT-0083]